ncbi:class III lanthionine synthetase LanKC [Saccharopolyspora mangrovi]|uniref:non-specific serine/threonine protein kinase n=1 Tax=Saccharopolyspora mangrovi TaxID=3082379 RepID=A0ABU6AJB7_9PSEU|nr:class III lanthionine synthetase LanKC [Saccharopolyspora sp. S2-29]MEB3371615.1 class III lanthionine synthetase LanKC [Saccharopolyspora sp. S2-29]
MREDLELYSLADRLFYEAPSRWLAAESTFDLTFPDGWNRGGNLDWCMARPAGVELPGQGWKIHVSATPDNAERVLDVVSRYCFESGIAFKFLRTSRLVTAYSLKYAPRSASGKLLTLYPVDDAQLEAAVDALAASLTGERGPYVLTDLRIGEGPVFVRYGGFLTQHCFTADGDRVLAIENPDGTLVPDDRRPFFTTPDWVRPPEFLKPHLDARSAQSASLGYQITEALHFSNGGGVYLAHRDGDGAEVVLKEARPLAGLDSAGRDAIARLEHEVRALRALDGVEGVPRVHEVVDVWEHRFAVLDRVPGRTLQAWSALHHPLVGPQQEPEAGRAYAERAVGVLERVGELLERIHERGVVFGDLHPANILVDDEDRVGLVDFESASQIGDGQRQHMGYAGFTDPEARGAEIDRQALGVLAMWLFLPLTSLNALSPGKAGDLLAAVEEHFELPEHVRGLILDRIRRPVLGTQVAAAPEVRFTDEAGRRAARESLAEAIRATATPERDDRLFPGDVQGFLNGGTDFAFGAAGILWALRTAGHEVDPVHAAWLREHASRSDLQPGFFDGAHGIAHVLDMLGHHDQAAELITGAEPDVARTHDVSLFGGLAGIGLNHLHVAGRDGEHLTRALGLADRLAEAVESGRSHGIDVAGRIGLRDAGSRGGLLRGWTGPALFFLRCFETTGQREHLDLAVRALHRDLDLCVSRPDGTLQVDGGFRTLPYLDVGSAGIGLIADQVLRHVPDERLSESAAALSESCRSTLVVQSGLFSGRAGLLATLGQLSRDGSGGRLPDSVVAHLSVLHWHALGYHGHLAFPGEGNFRLAMDFATGNAGVLAALASLDDSDAEFMPFLTPRGIAPAFARTRCGGEGSDSVLDAPEGDFHPGGIGGANNSVR